ncbi:MAG: DUF1549 domain-containing protein [Planctomycetaceae bacterium]
MRISMLGCIKRGLAALILLTAAANGIMQTGRGLLAEDASPSITDEDRDFWSFRRVERPAVPSIQHADRARTTIDSFLLGRLEAKGLGFSPDADKRTLIRRVYLDLVGLPPSPEEVQRFLADDSPDTYERVVDRLLASPHFGERWARHWLDAAGYVDTVGFDVDADLIITTEGKWLYRDYVIESFNDDKPYDRFLTEQLAGDELVDWRNAATFTPQIRESLIATGFLRTAQDFTHEDVGNIPQNYYGILHDTIEIVGSSLLGLTLNCARCHNHKFDPLPQEDYYRLMAVLTPAYNPKAWKIVFPYNKKIEDRALADIAPIERAAIDRHNADIDRRINECYGQIADVKLPTRQRLFDSKLQSVPTTRRQTARDALKIAAEKRSEEDKRFVEQLKVSPEEVAAALSDEQKHAVQKINDQIAQLNKGRPKYGRIQALYDVGELPITRQLISQVSISSAGADSCSARRPITMLMRPLSPNLSVRRALSGMIVASSIIARTSPSV